MGLHKHQKEFRVLFSFINNACKYIYIYILILVEVVTEHKGTEFSITERALGGVTVSGNVLWCTGGLLDLTSDFCMKVKMVAVSLPDRSPGDVRGIISLMSTPSAEPSSLHIVLVEASSNLVLFKAC